jgi:hypothetical protein
MVCINDVEERVFFIAKVFTLQKASITLWCTADKIPAYFDMTPNYTINYVNVGATSAVIQTSGNEKMHMTNVDQDGRQHKLSPYVSLNWQNYT